VADRVQDVAPEIKALAEKFFADAQAVDAADTVPPEHIAALADAGLYGATAAKASGGLGLDGEAVCDVIEWLASGCLASTFVWIQHFGLLRALEDPAAPGPIRRLLPDAVRGKIKGGVSLAGLLPGPPRLMAEPTGGDWVLRGEAPWVSGWGIVDVLLVTARGPADTTVQLLLDARPTAGLVVQRTALSAMNASATVRLIFDGVVVPGDRLVGQAAYLAERAGSHGLRTNGSLALGVVRRACALIGPSPLDEALGAQRQALATAGPDALLAARAAASALAVRAAHALAVHRGSRSALRGDVAERLTREAAVLLVFGSRPGIKARLLEAFDAALAPEAGAARVKR